jgi:hypothetical protein
MPETIVHVRRTVETWNTIPAEQPTVTIIGPGIYEKMGDWCHMCVPDGPDGEKRGGPATEVSDEVLLEALFGDQHIYDDSAAPAVTIEPLGDDRYRVTTT